MSEICEVIQTEVRDLCMVRQAGSRQQAAGIKKTSKIKGVG